MELLIVTATTVAIVAVVRKIEGKHKARRVKKSINHNWHCSQSRSWVTKYPGLR